MDDLLTVKEVEDRLLQWESGLEIEDTDRLCRDYLVVVKELEKLRKGGLG